MIFRLDPPAPYISILRDGDKPTATRRLRPSASAPSVPTIKAEEEATPETTTPEVVVARPVRTLLQCPFCMVLYDKVHDCTHAAHSRNNG